jgi:cold shock CspA family protein
MSDRNTATTPQHLPQQGVAGERNTPTPPKGGEGVSVADSSPQQSAQILKGRIKALKPSFGFITAEDGRDFFFHDDDLVDDLEVSEGDRVTFEVVEPQPEKGPRARDVSWQGSSQ